MKRGPLARIILAIIFAPIAWLLGVRWNDCAAVGQLLGTRLILNEFVASAKYSYREDSDDDVEDSGWEDSDEDWIITTKALKAGFKQGQGLL